MFRKVEERAKKILQDNLYEIKLNDKLYRRTVPSRQFYVHQWNWDSATHAMGLVHVEEERAFDELLSLVSGQWDNGLIAQITFNSNETKYFPGPQFWGTEKFANGEIITSGITQPPLLAISAYYVYKSALDKKKATSFIKKILPSVIKYHQYLKKYRDPENVGLLTVIHPWETGVDNSPCWDEPLKRINVDKIPKEVKMMVNKHRSDDKIGDSTVRPHLHKYYKYMHLVTLFNKWGWDYQKIVKESPFAVHDVMFDSIWCRANECLAYILELLGREKEANLYKNWSDQTRSALGYLWVDKDEIFIDSDIAKGENTQIRENTIASFLPLMAGVADEKILKTLLNKLTDKEQFWPKLPVPSTALNNQKFDGVKYWRGPTWPIGNLFVIEGLNRYEDNTESRRIRDALVDKTLKMIADNGFYEYYYPLAKRKKTVKDNIYGIGFGSMSWTAAIYIYIFHKYKIAA